MPVIKTTKTFKELRNKAEVDFQLHKPAVALVYHGGAALDFIGIRIECPKAQKEFVSRVPFGRDPDGELYYNDIKELTGIGKYEILFQVGEVLQIVIRNPSNGIVATFVGQDPAKATGWLEFDTDHPDVPLIGDWKDYNGFDVPSSIKCDQGSQDVTISLPSLSKKVTFKLPKPCVNAISHDGTTTVSDIKDISNGTYNRVDFNADRVLFDPDTGTTTMTAYFIPEIAEEADLVALGKQAFISTSPIAKWQSG